MKVRKTDQNIKKSQELTNSLVSCTLGQVQLTKSQAPMTSDTCTIKVSSFQVFIYSPCHCLQLSWKDNGFPNHDLSNRMKLEPTWQGIWEI